MTRRVRAWVLGACLLAAAVPAGAETVRHVVDGDTLILTDGRKVRLIGVDAPELHDDTGRNERTARRARIDPRKVNAAARAAKRYLREQLEGRDVALEADPAASATGLDGYGRTLAYVRRKDDGFFINAELISQGHALAFTKFPFRYTQDFKEREAQARRSKQGLWS